MSGQAQTPGQADLDAFYEWIGTLGYEPAPVALSIKQDAFMAGMQAARDLAAQERPAPFRLQLSAPTPEQIAAIRAELDDPQPHVPFPVEDGQTPAAGQADAVEIYRVRFEVVGQQALRKYSNADPLYYKNTTQTVPNSQIPDEDWHEVTGRETDSPWDQYNQLRKWEAADEGFVRNVRLEKLASEPRWEAVDDQR